MAPRLRWLCCAAAASAALAQPYGPYTLTEKDESRTFYGVGGISGGGATSRLLFDYPEPTRSSILDLLFKPQYGAALQQSKVEVPGDADTTNGAESSHRHDAADGGSYNRGYEWWITTEALARNPAILTSALMWAAPHFISDPYIGNGDSVFTPAGAEYVADWVAGGQSAHNFTLSVMGAGWNEHAFNATFIKLLRQVLDARGLSAVKVAASDEWSDPWGVAMAMVADPSLAAVVDYVSVHVAGYMDHNDPPPAEVLGLGKPLWQGEEHFGLPDPDPVPAWRWAAAGALGIEINQNWVRNNQTATIMWPHSYGWYQGIIYQGKGFLTATSPWGAAPVFVTTPLWIAAHTTHFTAAGTWNVTASGASSGFISPATLGNNVSFVLYLGPQQQQASGAGEGGSSSGISGGSSGSDGAATAPAAAGRRDWTLVVESMYQGQWHSSSSSKEQQAQYSPTTATFKLADGLLAAWAGASVHVWHTNQSVTFQQGADVTIASDGSFTLTIEPAAIYTITTVASAHPGARALMESLGPSFQMVGHGAGVAEDASTAAPSAVSLADPVPVDAPFPLPWADDFEGYHNDSLPLFLSDMFGAFATWSLTPNELQAMADQHQAGVGSAPLLPLRQHDDARVAGAVACAGPAAVAQRPGRCVATGSGSSNGAPVLGAGGANQVLRQYVRQAPIGWDTAANNMATIIGNYTLRNVRFNLSALIETPTQPVPGGDDGRTVALARAGSVVPAGGGAAATGNETVYIGIRAGAGCGGCDSPSAFYGSVVSAYTWRLAVDGSWTLSDGKTQLTAGKLPTPFGYDTWHALSLEDAPNPSGSGIVLVGAVDGAQAFSVSVPSPTRAGGYVVIGTGVNRAQFDNLLIDSL